jgi:hypothetical protein
MASGLGVDVCIYHKRVLDESRQRMSSQDIEREDSPGYGNVVQGRVDL